MSTALDVSPAVRTLVVPLTLTAYTVCACVVYLRHQRPSPIVLPDNVVAVGEARRAEADVLQQELDKATPRALMQSDTFAHSGVWKDGPAAALSAAVACLLFARAGAMHAASSSAHWLPTACAGLCWVVVGAAYLASVRARLQGRLDGLLEALVVPAGLLTFFGGVVDLRSVCLSAPHSLDERLSGTLVAAAGALLALELLWPRGREQRQTARPPPILAGASLLSRATFSYCERFLLRNLTRYITADDVPDLDAPDKAAATLLQFRHDAEHLTASRFFRGRRPPLLWQLVYHFRRDLTIMGAWSIIESVAGFMPAVTLRQLVEFLQRRGRGEHAPTHEALTWTALLVGFLLLDTLTASQALLRGRKASIRGRHIGIGEVYAKVLRRAELASVGGDPAKAPATTGKLQNLLSADVIRACDAMGYLHQIFPQGVLSIVLAIWLLYRLLGTAALVGIGMLVLFIPIQTWLTRITLGVQRQVLAATDRRLHLAQEVIQAIRVVKAFAWERSFLDRMSVEREAELGALRRRAILRCAQLAITFASSTVVSAATFWAHTKLFHRPLDAATAFGALALFNALRYPLDVFAQMIGYLIQAGISIGRIDAFLVEPDTAKWDAAPAAVGAPAIGFVGATCGYQTPAPMEEAESKPADGHANGHATPVGKDVEAFRLVDLTLDFPVGQLSLIVGGVGSGKSTMLLSLLKETTFFAGSAYLPSPVFRDGLAHPAAGLVEATAYCAQSPWLLSASVRDNILFGSTLNLDRYNRTLEACALLPDLATLPGGDHCPVGERGVGLSGGQKARISLARAVYSNARHLLLDDVLAAVDMHTAAHLLHRCLGGELMRDRTCVMVTNAVSLCLPLARYLVVFDDGRVAYSGSPVNAPADLVAQAIEVDVAEAKADPTAGAIGADDKGEKAAAAAANEEQMGRGAVGWAVWRTYLAAFGGSTVWIAVLGFYLVAQTSEVSLNLSLRAWAASYGEGATAIRLRILAAPPRDAERSTDHYLRVYAGLAVLTLVLFTTRTAFVLYAALGAARRLYNALIASLVGARTRFFDTVPVGRIMSRLARDVSVIDGELGDMAQFLTLEVFWTGGILVAIALVFPAFLLAAPVLLAAFYLVAFAYLRTSRELKRLESVSRSPIFGTVGESLNGVVSIRAYGDAPRFFQQVFASLDANARPYWMLWLSNRWLQTRTDFLGALTTLIVCLVVTYERDIDPALAGFMLTYALALSVRLMWLARLSADTQINMNSVERVKEYLDIEHEPTGGECPPAAWPARTGEIRFEHLSARYAPELPDVLREVSFTVRPGEKIGICGRTGSGKSTLGLTLLRFLEASHGRIVIDGRDIAGVALKELRERLVLIPQDATLFAGDVRGNLDPFGEFDDAQLWDALRRTRLVRPAGGAASAEDLPAAGARTPSRDVIDRLDAEIAEGGKNLSAGQRQLLAISRAILKLEACSILLLDEASASLDNETDAAIQRTIREEMEGATILCVAHRLLTIADFSRILVLGDGRVLEYDTPANLLRDDSSAFYALASRSGEFEALRAMALAAEARAKVEPSV